ncbi:hypothetical protein Mal15_13010 [Stieleria maiorica]|uniref:Uncharacterized protein n=1 Tax=Stieleria maiorica TaxID=2795974 RepID=A0A5B9M7Z8_9BACT|nr:hypothetical protein [Stieleria maiorica]QEF97262.1 hypothetical protein Mal15_13010 [Stieleria maiorica]
MKFRLRTLLALVTLCGLVAALGLRVALRNERLRQHRLSFEAMDDQVAGLDAPLRRHLLQIPAVLAELQAANPIDPPMAVSHSISGSSQRYGRYQFDHQFHYDWQLADGSRSEGITIAIAALIHEVPGEKHVVRLTYVPNELNSEIARWVAAIFSRNKHIQIRHVTDQTNTAAELHSRSRVSGHLR